MIPFGAGACFFPPPIDLEEVTPDAASTDAPDDLADALPPPCDLDADFTEPQEVGGFEAFAQGHAGGGMSADELTVVLAGYGEDGGWDAYIATRSSRDQPFGDVRELAASTPYLEYWPQLTPDGLELYFHADVPGRSPPSDVFVATRTSTSLEFGPSEPVLALAQSTVGELSVFPLEHAIYLNVQAVPGQALSTYRAARTVGGVAAPTPVEGIPVGAENPVVSADERTILFARRDGSEPYEIWIATRSSPAVAFDPPRPVAGVNTGLDEWPTYLTADGCRLYFQRRVADTSASGLWVASRP